MNHDIHCHHPLPLTIFVVHGQVDILFPPVGFMYRLIYGLLRLYHMADWSIYLDGSDENPPEPSHCLVHGTMFVGYVKEKR